MYKIAVIGDKDSILGFTALGMDVFPAYEANEIKKILNQLVNDNYGIIYMTEEASSLAGEAIIKYRDKPLPAIVTIPGNTGSMNLGANKIRECVKKAVGIDVQFKD